MTEASSISATEGTSNWYDSLPDNLRSEPSVLKFKSVEDLAAGYVGLQKLMGHPKEKLLVLPDDPNERSALAAKIAGYPEDPSSYDVPVPETVPADYRDPEKTPALGWFKGVAKELRIPPAVAGELYAKFIEYSSEVAKQKEADDQKRQVEQFELVKQQWGQDFDRNAAAANRALAAIDRLLEASGHKGRLADVLEKAGLASEPTVVNAMLALSKFFREDTIAGTTKPTNSTMEARADELLRRSIELLGKNPEEARRLAREAADLRLVAKGG
jgi:enamine deaminase RidA (YjgF/YER057c/UK114 family)